MPILTHARSARDPDRLDRLVERARLEARAADVASRCRVADESAARGETPATCSRCGMYLLPIEVASGVCRHCREGR